MSSFITNVSEVENLLYGNELHLGMGPMLRDVQISILH
jgi:hypothetical protein